MKRSKRLLWLFSAVIILAMIISSCAPAAPAEPVAPAEPAAPADPAVPESPAEKKILRVAYTREIDVLNPFTSQMLCDIEFTMVEGLIMNNEKGENIPVLAKEIPPLRMAELSARMMAPMK